MKKITVTTIKKKLWEECKRIIRARYGKDNTWNCYTCDRLLDEPSKAQTGHFIPSSTGGALLRYNLNNLRIQCYNCNINQGGAGAEYYRRLLQNENQEYVDNLFFLRHQTVKADIHWYTLKLEEYKLIEK